MCCQGHCLTPCDRDALLAAILLELAEETPEVLCSSRRGAGIHSPDWAPGGCVLACPGTFLESISALAKLSLACGC